MEGKPLVASCDVALFAKLATIVFAHPPYPECRFLIAIRLSRFRTSQCDLVHNGVLSWPFRTLCADRRRGNLIPKQCLGDLEGYSRLACQRFADKKGAMISVAAPPFYSTTRLRTGVTSTTSSISRLSIQLAGSVRRRSSPGMKHSA